MRPRLAVTVGEPAGIGPDLCVELAADRHEADLVFVGDPEVLRQRARAMGRSVEVRIRRSEDSGVATEPGVLEVMPVHTSVPVRPGHLDPGNAAYVLETLRVAGRGCLEEVFDAVVTAPVHKSIINDAGIAFSGHTEFFSELCGSVMPVMMLTAPGIRVALVTTHLPLRAVADAITEERLQQIVVILDRDLRRWFGLPQPRILVCGLNPHAGEGGHLGDEERSVIEPCLEGLRASGIDVLGPLPADTAFTPRHLHVADVVLAMYHDQGLPVLKQMGFGEAVNITLGLPIVRTSVDHGTALSLAGTGQADPGSLKAAVAAAQEMATSARPGV